MSIKRKENIRLKKWIRRLEEQLEETTRGHGELAKVQNAYVSILIKKLGATKEEPVIITGEEIKEALGKDNVRVTIEGANEFKFYIEDK